MPGLPCVGSSLRGTGFSQPQSTSFRASGPSGRACRLKVVLLVVGCGLSGPVACGISVSGTEPASAALEGKFLATGPPGKSLSLLSCIHELDLTKLPVIVMLWHERVVLFNE